MENFIEFLNESMDSSYDITHNDKKENTYRYYFNINNELYRIFIERINEYIHIGFEYNNGDKWVISGEHNNLTGKETLTLFGTIKYLVKKEKNVKGIMISTTETRKSQMYHNMMRKMNSELNFQNLTRDENNIYLFNDKKIYNQDFKYKIRNKRNVSH